MQLLTTLTETVDIWQPCSYLYKLYAIAYALLLLIV
jgi:hypothetical protein